MVAVLIGSIPLEGPITLANMAIPFILLADPVDQPAVTIEGALRVEMVPFKSDPLAVLRLPWYEQVTHVFSFTELGQLPAVLLAEALGVSSVPTSAVLRTRHKYFMRLALQNHMLQPIFGLLGSCDVAQLPYPVIVKPVDSSGSRNVALITTPGDLTIQERLATQDTAWLWEQYIEGPEFSVEAVTFQGCHHILSITEKVTTGAPHYVEVAHFSPARLLPEQAEHIKQTVMRCLSGLGITQGASHTEIKLAGEQAFLIETHTRAGGDRIALITKLVTGYDQYELAVRSTIGKTLPAPQKARYACAGVRYFRWKPGTIQAIEGREACQKIPGLIELVLTMKPGDRMPGWKDSSDRPGYAVIGGSSFEEVAARLLLAEELIQIRYK